MSSSTAEPFPRMPRVIIESPFAGNVALNLRYARAALRDSLLRGEAPIASHVTHTQAGVLDDQVPDERRRGISAGHAWMPVADLVAAYVDLGTSRGMEQGFAAARLWGIPCEVRVLPPNDLRLLMEAAHAAGEVDKP